MKVLNKRRLQIIILILLLFGVLFYFSLKKNLFTHHVPSTVLFDVHGQLLSARVSETEQWYFEESNPELSPKYVKALIEHEDKRFFRHIGIDFLALMRAIKLNIQANRIVSGGSTITMQTIRLHLNNPARTIWQKIREIWLALRLECRFSKEKILTLYAQHAPFGGNVIGIKAASWRYFGKNEKNLSWGEATLLAVLPNHPGKIHLSSHRTLLKEKRDKLLKKLMIKHIISEDVYHSACLEPIPQTTIRLPDIAPHLLEQIRLKNGPGIYHVTIEKSFQQQIQQYLDNHLLELRKKGIGNASALVLDLEKQEVVSYIGNSSLRNTQEPYVDMIESKRSTGSLLKPFLYAACIEDQLILPKELLPDYPFYIDDYNAKNFNKKFAGLVPADQALQRSLNVPFASLLKQYGIGKFLDKLHAIGMHSIDKSAGYYGIPLILGGAESNLWELTQAYANMGKSLNEWQIEDPTYNKNAAAPYHYIRDTKRIKKPTNEPVFLDIVAIYQTLHTLEKLERPTSSGKWKIFSSKRNISWKTGTSNGFKDGWAIGVNQKYAIGVWIGNTTGEGNPNLTGIDTAAPLLFKILSALPFSKPFSKPHDAFDYKYTCKTTGLGKSAICPVDSSIITLGNKAYQTCFYHKPIYVTLDNQYEVFKSCFSAEMKVDTILEIPLHLKKWFTIPPQQKRPPLIASCRDSKKSLKIVYPMEGLQIILSNLTSDQSTIICQSVHLDEASEVHWHLNHKYIGTTKSNHEIAVPIEVGHHTLSVVDKNGNTDSVKFQISE